MRIFKVPIREKIVETVIITSSTVSVTYKILEGTHVLLANDETQGLTGAAIYGTTAPTLAAFTNRFSPGIGSLYQTFPFNVIEEVQTGITNIYLFSPKGTALVEIWAS